jgi:SAM-dependent methyltransferase
MPDIELLKFGLFAEESLLISQKLKQAIGWIVPSAVYRPVLNWWRRPRPVRWGTLRRLTPVSRVFGFDRGLCIDRYYIENFLAHHTDDIQGQVLEIGDDAYTRRFGGERVTRSDVLHVAKGNPKATIVADLTCADHIPTDTFDCIIFTQTLLCIYDVRTALWHLHRILKPGGVMLATFPGISQISRYDMDRWGDYWRFTDASARRLFGDVFGPENVTIETYGNVLVACAFLHGLAAHELKQKELDYHDPDYQVIITVRAVKSK